MICGTAAWILVVVIMSANKGFEVFNLGNFSTEEECAYFREDQLNKKSVLVAECMEIK